MKLTFLSTLLTTSLAVVATAAPVGDLDERAQFKIGNVGTLKAQTKSTASNLRNLHASYENRARGIISSWSGSPKTAVQKDLQNLDAAVSKANQALQHIVSVLDRYD